MFKNLVKLNLCPIIKGKCYFKYNESAPHCIFSYAARNINIPVEIGEKKREITQKTTHTNETSQANERRSLLWCGVAVRLDLNEKSEARMLHRCQLKCL